MFIKCIRIFLVCASDIFVPMYSKTIFGFENQMKDTINCLPKVIMDIYR